MRATLAILSALVFVALAAGTAHARELVVEFDPRMVRPVHRTDLENPRFQWTFEVRVHNASDRPLRVVAFGSVSWSGDGWEANPRLFGSKEFTEWYTDGDPVEDGWIAPGKTAVDAASWHTSPGPTAGRTKWIYRSVDVEGNEFEVGPEIEYVPFVSASEWPDWPDLRSCSVVVEVAGRDGSTPSYVQMRLDRYQSSPVPFAVFEDVRVETSVPVPSLSMLYVYAPGHERVNIPVYVDAGTDELHIQVDLASYADTVPAEVTITGDEYAQAAADLYARWRAERDAYVAASMAYRSEHMDMEGFEFDRRAIEEEFVALMNDSDPALGRFAAFLSFDGGPYLEGEAAARRLELLPPSSPLWATSIMHVMNAASSSGEAEQWTRALLEQNPDRSVQAHALANLGFGAKQRGETETLTNILARLRDEYGDIDSVGWLVERLAKSDVVAVGQPVPSFDLPTLEDGVRVASAYRDGHTLLHFWATWCGPCMVEMPEVHAAFEEFGDQGVRFVSLSLDHERSAIERIRRKKWPMPWMHVFAKDDPDFDTRFGVSSIPTLFLIDPDGIVVAETKDLRGEKLAPTLRAVLENWRESRDRALLEPRVQRP